MDALYQGSKTNQIVILIYWPLSLTLGPLPVPSPYSGPRTLGQTCHVAELSVVLITFHFP